MWLAIETASTYMGVALWQPTTNIVWAQGESLGRGMSAALHPLLQNLFDQAQTSPSQLEGIVVDIGPGSFTSMRLGLAAAQGLALPFHTPIVGLDAFSLAVAPFVGNNQPMTIWIKAKESEVYVQQFTSAGQALTSIECLTLAEACQQLKPGLLVGGGVPINMTDWPAGVIVLHHPHLRLPDLDWLVRQGPRLLELGATDLTPLYIRPLNYRTLADVS